jgi:hypothetical protein
MPILSDTSLLVALPSGNRAVYLVQPQHLNPTASNVSQNENAHMYGRQVAVEINGDWFRPGLSEKITDLKTLALIERAPQADTIPGGRYA